MVYIFAQKIEIYLCYTIYHLYHTIYIIKMNIAILLFIIYIRIVSAKVEVIPIILGLWHSSHANEVENIINLKESQGCILFNVKSYTSATYLYFRCMQTQ